MKEEVKKDILGLLVRVQVAIKQEDVVKIKDLSNQITDNTAVYQDEYSISFAVIVHALGKIYERTRYKEFKTWPLFHKTVIENFKRAYECLRENNVLGYERSMQAILHVITKLEPKFQTYVKEVIEKSKIKKASRIHEHGVSISRIASLLGITEWELMDYVGKTGISDVPHSITKTMKQRLKFARGLFI